MVPDTNKPKYITELVTVDDVNRKKAALEKDINNLLETFTKQTGLEATIIHTPGLQTSISLSKLESYYYRTIFVSVKL